MSISNSNEHFYFIAEKNPLAASSIDQTKEIRFFFMLLLSVTAVLISGIYIYTLFHSNISQVSHSRFISPNREFAAVMDHDEIVTSYDSSIPQHPSSQLPSVELDSLLVRLTSGQNVRLSKVDITLHITDLKVRGEIQNSINKVSDHLIFILSAKDESVFSDTQKKAQLEREIINQLNLFLMAGKVEKIQLHQTFL